MNKESRPAITVAQVIEKLKAMPPMAEVTGVVARPLEGDYKERRYLCIFFCRENGLTYKTHFAYTFSKSDEEVDGNRA